MSRSTVLGAVATLVLLCTVVLVRQCSPDPVAVDRVRDTHSPLRVRGQEESRDRARQRSAAGERVLADDATGDADRRYRSGAAPGTIAEVLARARQRPGRREPGDSDLGLTGSTDTERIPGGSAPDAGARLQGKLQAASEGVQTSSSQGAKDPDSDDPSAPALSLKLNESTLPDKGDTAPLLEQGIIFDHEGAYFGEDAVLAMPPTEDVAGSAGTISFWLQPDWDGNNDLNAALFQWRTNAFENRIQIFKNGPYLRFLFCDNTGIESGVSYGITHWKAKETHVITCTWGDGVTTLYVDGRAVGAREYNGDLEIPPNTPWFFGSDHAGGAPGAQARLGGYRIFPRVLLPEEVSALAANTLAGL